MILYTPTVWLSYSEFETTKLLLEITTYPIFVGFFTFVLFFEGMKGKVQSNITTFFLIATVLAIGYCIIDKPWEFFFGLDNRWHQVFTMEFNAVFGIIWLAFISYLYIRLIQFIKEKKVNRPKKMTVVAIFGLSIAAIGMIISVVYNIYFLDMLSYLIGFVIVAFAYLSNPESFFLSNTRVEAIFLLHTESQILYMNLGGAKGADATLAAAGLGGALMVIQEILDDEHPTSQLVHKNKGFLFEYDFEHKVTAIMIVDQINSQLRAPLRYALSKFVNRYKEILPTWDRRPDTFSDFEVELRNIFRFALGKDILKSSGN